MDKIEIAQKINKQFNLTKSILDRINIWVTNDEWASICEVCETDFYEVLKGEGSKSATQKVALVFGIKIGIKNIK